MDCVVGQRAFDLKLNHFGHFGKKVWFVKIPDKTPLVRLQRKIKSAMWKLKTIFPESAHATFNPHITLAYKDVTPVIFDGVKKYLVDRHIEGHVRFDHVAILRDTGKKMVVHKRFLLKPR